MATRSPVDPKLRKDFDNTPNEDRSAKEIATWWDRPYAITMPDGSYDVRCLGAEDLVLFHPRPGVPADR